MLNVEIKARYPDLVRGEAVCRELGARDLGIDRQTDVYFRVSSGRLKLRFSTLGPSYLVSYQRANDAGPRDSRYDTLPVEEPEKLKSMLAGTLGIKIEVVKERHIFLHGNVRIHLDELPDLGSFVEFEAMVDDEAQVEAERERVNDLMARFGIDESQLIGVSYSDMIESR